MQIDVIWLGVDSSDELERGLTMIARERSDAIYATGTHVNYTNAKQIADFALKRRLPSFGFPKEGMLMTYEANWERFLFEALRS